MKRNILILICLGLMAAAVWFAINIYTKLNAAEKSNAALLKDNERLLEENKVHTRKLDSIVLAEKTKNLQNNAASPEDSASNVKRIEQYKTDNENFIKQNDAAAYQKALQLEKEGFTAIIENKLDVALAKFNEIVSIAPSFHSAYEISKLLTNNKAKFADASTQQHIKELITTKYKWKAPAEKINIIKAQLNRTPAITNDKTPVKPTATFNDTKKDLVNPSAVKPVIVKPQNGTNKLNYKPANSNK